MQTFPANNQYSAAMKFYMEAGIVSSEFFANAVPKSIYDDNVYRKMMKCCSYLQCHTQASTGFRICFPAQLCNLTHL
ncbi:hypothetical protein DPMN_178250 [Dreissena polymorpha]|uniref:INTS8 TPR repeats domain-containing protein n=1 Tax=Dreissena polymorpha TaxID=45954 RepID=A0A9D4EAI9_DREPO|nr:hypothetical protein DPMN_178250 [Dreissena polymorpha]